MNMKRLFLLVSLVLMVLCISTVSAAGIDGMNEEKVILEETSSTGLNNLEEYETNNEDMLNDENKILDNKSNCRELKTASAPVKVSDFQTLYSLLTSANDNLTVSMESDITLEDSIDLNSAVKLLTIEGNNKTINGQGKYQFLDIPVGSSVIVNNLVITGCNQSNGGVIHNRGNLSINNSYFTNNEGSDAGVIYNNRGNVNITSSNFINNSAQREAGALRSYYGNMIITNSFFGGNYAGYAGGALCNYFGNLSISDTQFIDNTATTYGGAIANSGNLEITYSDFTHNVIAEEGIFIGGGGAIDNLGNLSINYSLFNNNIVYGNNTFGGAVANHLNAVIDNSNFTQNFADRGGALYNGDERYINNLNITNSDITNNRAKHGGAILNEYEGSLVLVKSNLTDNLVLDNDSYVVCFDSLNTVTITDNNFVNNTDNKRDMLFSDAKTGAAVDIHSNTYLNNFLKTNMTKLDDVTISTPENIQFNYTINVSLRPVYNHTINTGNITVSSDELKEEYTLINGTCLIKIENNQLPKRLNIISYNYTSSQRDYQNINETFNIYKLVQAYLNISLNPSGSVDVKDNITVTVTLYDQEKPIKDHQIEISVNGEKYNLTNNKTNENGQLIFNYTVNNYIINNITGKLIFKAKHVEDNNTYYNTSGDAQAEIKINKINPVITLDPVTGVIGENITLTAHLTDKYGNPVTGGNIVFKLNGLTLKTNGIFGGNTTSMKFHVTNKTVTHTITLDPYLQNTKNMTITYSGNEIYNQARSKPVEVKIHKRNAQLNLTIIPAHTKQYDTITIKAHVSDTTPGAKNNTIITDNTKIIIKINGITLKDDNGQIIFIPIQKDRTATYNYTIPAGMAAITITGQTRNNTITSIFISDNYYPVIKNSTTFQVEISNTTIEIENITVTKNNKLNIRAKIKDYMNKNVVGNNKIIIKINGITYKNPTTDTPQYWTIKDGNINLTDIQVNPDVQIENIMIVTGERQAYLGTRIETQIIKT